MKRVLPVFLLFLAFIACRSTYNEDAVKKLIKQPYIRAWTDTFVNNSNLITSKHYEVMVISSKELPNREVKAIKQFLRNKHETDDVTYHYRPKAYQ